MLWLPLALACSASQPKRLVIPNEMRRPLATGQTVREATAPAPGKAPGKSLSTETFAVTDDLTGLKAPGAAPAARPAPAPVPAPSATGLSVVRNVGSVPKLSSPAVPTDPAQRYTLRLVERGRVWEFELPESTGGYEVRIPLGPGIETPTEADQEMLGKTPPPGRSKSYLATLAKVGEMYSSHRYELALIEVVDLEQQYPKEPRILAMKGSLYQKLGKTGLAREAWKKALEIDPSDTTIAEALRALKEE
jgi:hypothetical protein